MRISFLKPPTRGILGLDMITFTEPLGLECIAGALETDGHECQIVDIRIDGERRGIGKVRRFDPHLIGIQSTFTTERFSTYSLARKLKKEFPGAAIVVGGHDASRDPGWFATAEGVDAVAIGDGEMIVPELVRAIEARRELSTVPGLMVTVDGEPIRTGPAPATRNVDDLPFPARHLVAGYANNYYINFCRPLALLETARGCPYRCNFCSVWKFHGGTYREKSPARVLRELRDIRAPHVFVTDDIFWANAERSRELARLIVEAGIRKHFFVQTRSDVIVRSPELVEAWKDCGPLTVFIGLERIDDEGLRSVNKRNDAATNNRAIEILQELGVGYTPNFVIDPEWGHEDFARLRQWITQTGAYNSGFSVLTPLPGTDLWDQMKDRVTTRDWELFDLEHAVLPTRLSLDQFYEEYAGLWRHALEVRRHSRGRSHPYLKLIAGLVTRKVTLTAVRKGIRIGKILGQPSTFLTAHRNSKRRLAQA